MLVALWVVWLLVGREMLMHLSAHASEFAFGHVLQTCVSSAFLRGIVSFSCVCMVLLGRLAFREVLSMCHGFLGSLVFREVFRSVMDMHLWVSESEAIAMVIWF